MAEKRNTSVDPIVPEILSCPRCGQPILLGDVVCSRCGYFVQTAKDRLRSQPPVVVSVAAFVIGALIAAAAIGMDNPWQFITLVVGFGIIVSGGLYYAADLLFLDKHNRRRK
jgi:predicted nucleic acid-binding Zn ribbon protein